jgi:hypothetical protein
MNLTIPQYEALYKLYPNVHHIIADKAFDAEGNEVEYDLESIEAKIAEDAQAQESAKQTAQAKLEALGLTTEDLKALLGK